MFLIGLIGFTAASTACGLAVDPTMFIVTRLVQGGFGALLIPQGFGILLGSYPREEVSKAFSAFDPVMGIATIGGPILAGFIPYADVRPGFGAPCSHQPRRRDHRPRDRPRGDPEGHHETGRA